MELSRDRLGTTCLGFDSFAGIEMALRSTLQWKDAYVLLMFVYGSVALAWLPIYLCGRWTRQHEDSSFSACALLPSSKSLGVEITSLICLNE